MRFSRSLHIRQVGTMQKNKSAYVKHYIIQKLKTNRKTGENLGENKTVNVFY